MSGMHAFWNDIWPNLAASAMWAPPAFAWHHWKIRFVLSRHLLKMTATLNNHLEIMAGVGDAEEAGTPAQGPSPSQGIR